MKTTRLILISLFILTLIVSLAPNKANAEAFKCFPPIGYNHWVCNGYPGLKIVYGKLMSFACQGGDGYAIVRCCVDQNQAYCWWINYEQQYLTEILWINTDNMWDPTQACTRYLDYTFTAVY
jgi:hypothetical protein